MKVIPETWTYLMKVIPETWTMNNKTYDTAVTDLKYNRTIDTPTQQIVQ